MRVCSFVLNVVITRNGKANAAGIYIGLIVRKTRWVQLAFFSLPKPTFLKITANENKQTTFEI